MLDASAPLSPLASSILLHSPFCCLFSKLVNSQRNITEQIRQIDSFPSRFPFRSFVFSLVRRLTFLYPSGSQTRNKVAVNRRFHTGSGRFTIQILRDTQKERKEERGKKVKWLRPGPSFSPLVFANWLSPHLFSPCSSLFRSISFLPPAALSPASSSRGGN